MIPPAILYVIGGAKRFVLYYGIPLLLLYALLQEFSFPLMLVSLLFLGPTVLMGELYRRSLPARLIISAGTASIIAELLVALIVSYAFGYQVILEMQNYLWESYQSLPALVKTGASDEAMRLTIEMAAKMIPLFMIITALFYTSITHALGGRLLRALNLNIPALPPIREWMLPRSVVWYYLIAMLMDILFKKEPDSVLTMILINGIPLLMIAFAVQAVSFLSYVAYMKRWSMLLPIAAVLAFPFLPSVVSLLGVIDAAFPIRKGIQKR